MENRNLLQENARLSDLTRMLLSSQQFSSFLNDISVNGLPAPQTNPPTAMLQNQAPESQDVQMPTPPNGLPPVTEQQGFDFAALDVNGPGWNSGIDVSNYNAPVFAVLDVPEPQLPEIESAVLGGKDTFCPLPLENAKELPMIERPLAEPVKPAQADPDVEIDESDPAFALFLDQPAHTESNQLFGYIQPEKAFSRIDLTVSENSAEPPDMSAVTMARFERLCASIEGPYQRVCQLTSHLE